MSLDHEHLAALIIAVTFAAGLNVYATVATLGLLARFGGLILPGELDLLSSWWVIGASGALFAIELVADKIPLLDLIWNTLQTFVRVPVGALMAYAAAAHLAPGWQLAASVAGGAIAFAAHSAKTAARVSVSPSPEPFSNFALSAAEDAFAIFITWFATRHPFVAAAIVLLLLVGIAMLIRWIVAGIRLFVRDLRRQSRSAP